MHNASSVGAMLKRRVPASPSIRTPKCSFSSSGPAVFVYLPHTCPRVGQDSPRAAEKVRAVRRHQYVRAMSWHLGRLAAFDVETTGTDPESDRIVTAALSIVGAGLRATHHSWIVDPGVEIPAEATAVHGVSTERARMEGADPAQVVSEIIALLAEESVAGVPVVAFNARFDLTILDREARRHGVVPLIERVQAGVGLLVIDPYVLDKEIDRYRPGKRTLDAVCAHYRVSLGSAHEAGADALAAARVAYRLGSTVPELAALDLELLHANQVGWAAAQAASLQEYFLQQGRAEHVEGAWPVVPQPATALAA